MRVMKTEVGNMVQDCGALPVKACIIFREDKEISESNGWSLVYLRKKLKVNVKKSKVLVFERKKVEMCALEYLSECVYQQLAGVR